MLLAWNRIQVYMLTVLLFSFAQEKCESSGSSKQWLQVQYNHFFLVVDWLYTVELSSVLLNEYEGNV